MVGGKQQKRYICARQRKNGIYIEYVFVSFKTKVRFQRIRLIYPKYKFNFGNYNTFQILLITIWSPVFGQY